jgi:hypothetical protein
MSGEPEWDAMYQELCLYTTAEERGALAIAFLSGDEAQKQAAIRSIQERQAREASLNQ